jgi:hypothetical protein
MRADRSATGGKERPGAGAGPLVQACSRRDFLKQTGVS